MIFYTQEGPKGDLEFSHDGSMNIEGSVQCNGAIYLGGIPFVNDWDSLGSSDASYETVIGAISAPQRVNGVYGIYRLDKRSLFFCV